MAVTDITLIRGKYFQKKTKETTLYIRIYKQIIELVNNNITTHLLLYKTGDLGDKDMCLRQYMRIDIRKDAFSIKRGKKIC